jgi:LTXXQ motif family protein
MALTSADLPSNDHDKKQELTMSKLVAYAFTALFVAVPSLAIAQTPPAMQQAQAESRELTEVRIDVVKNALQLSADQTKYWPAIEEAIRARAEMRRQRLENFSERMDEAQPDRNFVKVMQDHAAALTERGTSLRRLADAWQPLYATLNDAQKRRMRVLAVVVLHGMREGIENRIEEQEVRGSAAVGASTGEGGFGR